MQTIRPTQMRWHSILFTALLATSFFLETCLCISFYIHPHQKKCFKQEMYANQLAVGEYEISDLPGTTIDMTITDTKGHIALNREMVDGKGKFAVTSDTPDFYELCFSYTSPPGAAIPPSPREISVDYRVGAEAKNRDAATDDQLNELEHDLDKIDDMTNAIIMDFANLRRRGLEMRNTNDSTNNRLFYQSITSIIIILVLATWQVLYLRTYFRARKLID